MTVDQPRSLDRFMVVAVAALATTVAVSLVSIAFDVHRMSVIARILSDASAGAVSAADVSAADASDSQTAVIAVVEIVALVLAAGCFIAWFRRAYRNLPSLGASSLRYGPGWAIGAWFVPVLGLWRPKQIANDIGSEAVSIVAAGLAIALVWTLTKRQRLRSLALPVAAA